MSIFSKIAEFMFGPSTQPARQETKVEAVNQKSVSSLPEGKPAVAEAKVASGTPAKKPRAKKADNWLEKDVVKPAGKRAQTPAAGKAVRKAKANTK